MSCARGTEVPAQLMRLWLQNEVEVGDEEALAA